MLLSVFLKMHFDKYFSGSLWKMETSDNKGNGGHVQDNILHDLIFVDIVFITISIIFQVPDNIQFYIQLFDLIVCIILLGEYFYSLITVYKGQ